MSAQPKLVDLLDLATEAAYLAGRRTLAYFNAGVEAEYKGDNTPVTIADREAENVIRQAIARHYPTHTLIGEEGGEAQGDPDYKWIIDPIDGTKSFIHGVPLYGVLIGVEVRGRAQVGVIYMPALDEMLCAAEGFGARWNNRVARVSEVSELKDATLLAGSITRAMARSDAYDTLSSKVKLNRGWGDCYGYLLVATGRAEIMLDPQMNPWDCAPMLPILREAGGHFTTWSGEATIWGPDACATNGGVNGEVLRILRAEKRRAQVPGNPD